MDTATTTHSDKQIALATLMEMPDHATLAEIAEEFAILAGIYKGLDDIEAGRVLSHEEVVEMSSKWIIK